MSAFGAKVVKVGCHEFGVFLLFYSLQYIIEGQDYLFLQSLVKLTSAVSGPTAGVLWVDF